MDHKIIGLIGFPLDHSRSPEIYRQMFREQGLKQFSYKLFPLKRVEDLKWLLMAEPNLTGLNVTIPYKRTVIPYLNATDTLASEIGAVNAIRIDRTKEGSRLTGYNTDAEGFLLSSDFSGHHAALILGTGGAAKAVAYALKKLGIAYKHVSRSKAGGHMLAYNKLDQQIMEHHTLIINATPAGMYPNLDDAPPIPYQMLTPRHFLYDLIYNPEKTRFLKQGKQQGTKTQSGLQMLIKQAELSLKLLLKS